MKVYKPVEDGHYEFLIGRYAYIEEDGKRFGMNVPEYDCNTGEWLESPCYVDMHDIRLCRLVEQPDAPAVQKPLICATCNDYLEAGARCEMCYGSAVSAYEETGEELDALKAQAQPAAPDVMPQMWTPDWANAPTWAMWWSVSADGRSWWHQAKPEEDQSGFVGGWKGQYAGNVYPDWRLSLRERVPTGEEPPPHTTPPSANG